jgi:hypothetical protein
VNPPVILFEEDTREVGKIGIVVTGAALALCLVFRWPPPPFGTFWCLVLAAVAIRYLYFIAYRRRRVVTLLDDELIWNTSSLTGPPLSAIASQIGRYRVEGTSESYLYRGKVRFQSMWYEIGDLPLEVHQRIFSALQCRNPEIKWDKWLPNNIPASP